jgi:hypothetical protein
MSAAELAPRAAALNHPFTVRWFRRRPPPAVAVAVANHAAG